MQAQKKVIISPRSKALEERRMSKEIEKYDQYFKERTARAEKLSKEAGKSMLRGIQCKEAQALKNANIDNPKAKSGDSSDEFEIDMGVKTAPGTASGFSLRGMLAAKPTRPVSIFKGGDDDLEILLGKRTGHESEEHDSDLEFERNFRQ
jgi:hypothetical protein